MLCIEGRVPCPLPSVGPPLFDLELWGLGAPETHFLNEFPRGLAGWQIDLAVGRAEGAVLAGPQWEVTAQTRRSHPAAPTPTESLILQNVLLFTQNQGRGAGAHSPEPQRRGSECETQPGPSQWGPRFAPDLVPHPQPLLTASATTPAWRGPR